MSNNRKLSQATGGNKEDNGGHYGGGCRVGGGHRDGSGRGNYGGRGDGMLDETSMVTNRSDNGDNNGNRNNIVYGDIYSNIGDNDQEGSSYSLKINIPKMNGNNYNELAQIVCLVLYNKKKLGF
ncbi:unnamed protein product [Lathyrus sativus]|nr:unnamed protein product [Lathyrus sativus]